MRRPTLAVLLYGLLIFVSGVAVGSFGHSVYASRTAVRERPNRADEFRRRYVGEMRKRLNLTADQERQLNAILDGTKERFDELHARYRPEVEAIQEDQAQRIRLILTEEQRGEYEAMRREREMHRRPKRGKPPKMPGGC